MTILTSSPSLAGFQEWTRIVMGVPVSVLPDDSPITPVAYQVALDIVNEQLQCLGNGQIYTLAVYNLGGDNLINYAQDQTSPPPSPPPANAATYWTDLRAAFHIGAFVAGVISGSADQGTSQTILNPDFMKGLTMANLQQLKTPYGRQYLAFAQDVGTLWGLS